MFPRPWLEPHRWRTSSGSAVGSCGLNVLGRVWGVAALGILTATACAPKPPSLPTGTSTPFPDFRSAYDQASERCRAVRTLTLSMSLSGRAGSTKLRGRVDAGFEAPARARLEGIAPFGKPVFILVADGGRGTLVLPREDRVLRDAPAEQILAALAGVPLDPASLRAIVAGCGFSGVPIDDAGQKFANGWVGSRAPENAVFLRPAGNGWAIAGAVRGPLTVFYTNDASGKPASIRVLAESGGAVTADLTLRISDVDVNPTLDPRTFDITADIPPRAVPLTLEELRRAGPLGGRDQPNPQLSIPQVPRER